MISKLSANELLTAALRENRADEFLEALWAGGSATLDERGKLIIISQETILDFLEDDYE